MNVWANANPSPPPVVWWTPDCGYLHVETAPLMIGTACPDGVPHWSMTDEIEVPATEPDPPYADDSPPDQEPEGEPAIEPWVRPETDPAAETQSGVEPNG